MCSSDLFAYWRMRRVQDAGDGVEIADMNFRFLPALTAGLAYHIAVKVPELMQRVPMLKQMYDEAYEVAAGEDREQRPESFATGRHATLPCSVASMASARSARSFASR